MVAKGTFRLPSITNLVNESMSTGIVPTKMKPARVTRFLKKPSLDKNVMENFRPISNLSFISKLTERVVLKRFTDHILRNNLHGTISICLQTESQYRNSTDACAEWYFNEPWQQIGVVLIMLDLSAAFDTVDNSLLLGRMRSAGVIGIAHQWWCHTWPRGRDRSV